MMSPLAEQIQSGEVNLRNTGAGERGRGTLLATSTPGFKKRRPFMVTLRTASIALLGSLALLAAGCAERHRDIPSSAQLVAEDRTGKIDFVAPDDGDIYVEDNSSNKLLYSGKINRGEHVRIDPMKDKLMINDQVVRDQKIRDLNEVRVFFKPEPQADLAGSRSTAVQPVHVHPAEAQPAPSGETEILVAPRRDNEDAEIRVKPGSGSDSRVTVEPADEGAKVTVEQK
jgi:hypothetical protein